MKTNEKHVFFEDKKIIINIDGNKKIVEFPYPIVAIQEFDDFIVVLIDPFMKIIFNENIFGVSYEGKITWQIEKTDHLNMDSPYTGIGKEEKLLAAYNWDAYDYLIDPKTGKVISKEYVK